MMSVQIMSKYEALGIPFRCANIPECTKEAVDKLSKLI